MTELNEAFCPKDGRGNDPNDWRDEAGYIDSLIITNEPMEDERLEFFTIPADFDPLSIPPRDWLIPGLLLRGYMTAILAPGGVGKSVYWLATAIAMASGRDILNQGIGRQYRGAVINNEDNSDELKRRAAEICRHFDIPFSAVTDTLSLFSGYGHSLTISEEIDGVVVATPNRQKLTTFIQENAIDAILVDPFISTHESEENNNNAIDKVVGIYKAIMQETGTAFGVAHHTRKSNADSEANAGNVEAGRGAKSMTDAARVAVTLCGMSKATAKQWGIEWELGCRLVRLDDAKKNYSLSDEKSTWFHLASHCLPNGDWVGVPEPYDVEPHIIAAKQTDKKWTATSFAEAIDPICTKQPDTSEISWTNIRAQVMSDLKIGRTQASENVTLLSQNKASPTRIYTGGSYVDYWIGKLASKDGAPRQTSPWTIHRAELS